MAVEYVEAGQRFAGGILTEAGAEQVNAHRARLGRGEKESVAVRLMRTGTSNTRELTDEQIKAISSTPY